MSDNLKKKGPQDRSKINIHESYEVSYWSKKLGISKDELKKVVEKTGPSVAAVKKYLKG